MDQAVDRETSGPAGPAYVATAAARWIAAVICIFYGFAKVNGSQFTVIDSEVTKPLGEVSGFWLTWYYFGYSATYGMLVAAVQIVGGVLLIVPKTSLLGALVLIPIAANIVLIDIFFGIRGALVPAVVLLGSLIVVATAHARPLIDVVLMRPTRSSLNGVARAAAAVAIIGTAYAFSWWVANYNNRRPTAIDGVWTVVADTRPVQDGQRWTRVFFERNRAHMAVFRRASGEDEQKFFDVAATGNIRVRETYTSSADVVMEGTANSAGEIELEIAPVAGGGHLRLTRSRREGSNALRR